MTPHKILLAPIIVFSLSLGPIESTSYLWNQVSYGVTLLWGRKPISEVLNTPKLAAKYKDKLLLLADIKQYAQDHGLTITSSYSTMVFPPDDPDVVSYLVVAAKPFSLDPHTYWFPFAGDVPYLGFFQEEDRDQHTQKLKDQGYDVYLTQAAAFSLLGYIEDPIFPSMLTGNAANMAHLFFHELTHTTIWKKNSAEFNENIAEFISYTLTSQFLQDRKQHKLLRAYNSRRQDQKLFYAWIADLKKDLRLIYDHPTLTEAEKKQKKQETFRQHLDHPPSFQGPNLISNTHTWNNARLALLQTYSPNFDVFNIGFRCFRDTKKDKTSLQKTMKAFIAALNKTPLKADASLTDYMEKVCTLHSSVTPS